MKKFSIMLLPLLVGTGLFVNGCDSSCCGPVPEKVQKNNSDPQPNLEPPKAAIILEGSSVTANGECTPNERIVLQPASTDKDGTIQQNIWKIDGQVVGNTEVICPNPNETKTICLTAVDNDGLKSGEVCKTLTGKAVQTTPQATPPAVIIESVNPPGDTIFMSCEKVHDTDTLHLHPEDAPFLYGSNTPKDIKEITWTYTYHNTDGTVSGPTSLTMTEYNLQENKPAGSCQKYFHRAGVDHIDYTITVRDDDRQESTKSYTYNIATGALTEVN